MNRTSRECSSAAAMMEPLEPRVLLDATSVMLGVDANAALAFQDADGSKVNLKIGRGGLADVTVTGDGAVSVDITRGRATVTGVNLRMTSVDVLAAGGADLRFNVRGGDGVATLGAIDATGMDLGHIRAAEIVLADGPGIAADSTQSIRLRGAANTAVAVVDLGDLTVGSVDALDLTAQTGRNWRFTDTVSDSDVVVNALRSLRFDGVVDLTTAQALIEVKLVEVRSAAIDVGFEFADVTGRATFGDGVVSSIVDIGNADGTIRFDGQVRDSAVTVNQARRGVTFDEFFNSDLDISSARGVVGALMSGGSLSLSDAETSVLLRGLEDAADVSIFSVPRVTIESSQQSSIVVTQTDQFRIGETAGTDITLNVAPRVAVTGDAVDLMLVIERTDDVRIGGAMRGGLLEITQPVGGVVRLDGPVDGAAIVAGVVPALQLRGDVLDSTIVLAEGETVVLGGRQSEVSDSAIRVPILGEMSILGRVFRNNTIETDRAMQILIRPEIVDSVIDPITLDSLILAGGMDNSVVVAGAFTGEIVVGDMVDSVIYSGVDLGADGLFNTGDETWTPGFINDADIRGTISGSSLIGVGVNPGLDGLFFSADDVGVGGVIANLAIRHYDDTGAGLPANAYGVTAAQYITSFRAGRTRITAIEGTPFVDHDFNVNVPGL